MRHCAPGRPEPCFSASPFPLPALPPPQSGTQSFSGCAVEAQYVSIELNCCGRRLYAAAEPGSARRYSVEIYVLNDEAKSCSWPSKIKRGRYSHEAKVRDEGRPSSQPAIGGPDREMLKNWEELRRIPVPFTALPPPCAPRSSTPSSDDSHTIETSGELGRRTATVAGGGVYV